MRKALASLSVIGLIVLASCDTGPRELRLVTPVSPVTRGIAEELTELFNVESTVRLELTDAPLAEEAALAAIASGDADIALVSNNLPFREDIATVMPLYPTVLHIARRAAEDGPIGGNIFDPEIFSNSAIFAGPAGSASRLVFETIADRIGLQDDDYRYTVDPESAPDFIVVIGPISPERVAEFPGYVLASLGTPQEIGTGGVVDTAVLLNPQFRPFIIPVGTYDKWTPEPIVTVAVDKILVARGDLDSTIVYDLINEILRLRPAMAAKRPGLFQQLSDDFDTSRSTYIVHAGTQAYLQRSAPSVYERYSGVAEVAVTLIVALGSTLFAGVRIFRMRRKNRIDTFYSKTIELQRSVTSSTNDDERQRVIQELRDLQSTAFDLLVGEKLAADESFRIFITLSNDVLGQLGARSGDGRLSDT